MSGGVYRNPTAREHVFWNRSCEWVCAYRGGKVIDAYEPQTILAIRTIPIEGIDGFLRRTHEDDDNGGGSVMAEEKDYQP